MNTTESQNLYQKHQILLEDAIKALHERTFFSPYPEHPKAYNEEANAEGLLKFQKTLNTNFSEFNIEESEWLGEEVSPFMQTGLGIKYPVLNIEKYIDNANASWNAWQQLSVQQRAGILTESLEKVKDRFFELAYATMHTTGQSFLMSFQASGPHACDRSLEAIAVGLEEITQYPEEVNWIKPMGKFDLSLKKNWKAMPKGIGLVIGCSTFPTWNTVPGLFANLITGNPSIVKPHPKAILPIAIFVSELRNVIKNSGLDENVVQLVPDTPSKPITKDLAEHEAIKLIDYTGNSTFGNYIEGLNKQSFTEKAGVNCVLLDSVKDIKAVAQNIAFSASLYSGQMCTAPQNIFISANGVKTDEGILSFEETVNHITQAIEGLVNHPKMGAGTLGAIQNDNTMKRLNETLSEKTLALDLIEVENPEFENARIATPRVVVLNEIDRELYMEECFGPIIFIIKTRDSKKSLEHCEDLSKEKGAITCLCYTTNQEFINRVEETMNKVFTPVSFNFTGAAFVNQHAAFSDLHVSGGNAAGNASFINAEYILKRFVWVGNRYAHI